NYETARARPAFATGTAARAAARTGRPARAGAARPAARRSRLARPSGRRLRGQAFDVRAHAPAEALQRLLLRRGAVGSDGVEQARGLVRQFVRIEDAQCAGDAVQAVADAPGVAGVDRGLQAVQVLAGGRREALEHAPHHVLG